MVTRLYLCLRELFCRSLRSRAGTVLSLVFGLFVLSSSFGSKILAGDFSSVQAAGSFSSQAVGIDSVRAAALNARLKEYLAALELRSVDVKIQECDTIIGSCKSREVRNYVVTMLYGHYVQSPLMGDDAVAVSIVDKWIATGKAELGSVVETMNAKIYADFNRSSLIGLKAPGLQLETPDGQKTDALEASDGLRVLYFYATDCSKCKLESRLLGSFLSSAAHKLDVLIVNTGSDRGEWDKYRADYFSAVSRNVRVFHYWDPEAESDFQRKYGVLQTPKMFLIDEKGIIVGRGLNTEALTELVELESGSYVYGNEASVLLFDNIFSSMPNPTAEDVVGVAKYIDGKLYGSGQTELFKRMAGDFMYYLSGRKGFAFKSGERYVVDSLIISRPSVWNSREDTLKVVGMAKILDSMLSRADIGTLAPDIRVPGVLKTARRSKDKFWNLRKLRRNAYVLFYTEGCLECAAELEAAETFPSRGNAVLLVDMDKLMKEDKALAERLLDIFDLSAMPYVTRIDNKGIVRGKYLTLRTGSVMK